jgi:predicted ATPase/transcriptional regulator with XRE-family HTH domain
MPSFGFHSHAAAVALPATVRTVAHTVASRACYHVETGPAVPVCRPHAAMDDRATPSFATLLRRYRLEAGLSQEGLAERAGLSRLAVSALERGVRRAPYRDTVRLLADALDLNDADRNLLKASVGRARGTHTAPATASPHNARVYLPVPSTSFIGRHTEQATVRRLLSTSRLLCLTGAGGVGKTRLALQIAAGVGSDFPDGVRLVELAPLADPSLVPAAMARAFGIQEQPGRAVVETLLAALQEQHLLVVLDNCEHVRAPTGELTERLLTLCPHLHILATSREALGVPGETVWRVPPMGVGSRVLGDGEADAVALFVERARHHQPELALMAAGVDAVAEICRRLDGIPLAIELAAARTQVLTPRQIADRLDDRLRLLTRGTPGAPARQQTLRATLDWSYDLLTEAERCLFIRLSVFAGGCDLEAVESVCANDSLTADELIDVLTDLAGKSLLTIEYRDEVACYRMLETVRQYAAEKLDEAGECAIVRGHHLAWCMALAEQSELSLQGPEQARWLARLDAEHDNLRAALAWAFTSGALEAGLRLVGAAGEFWTIRGYWAEGRTWQARLEAEATDVPILPAVRAKALVVVSHLARMQGDFEAARSLAETSLALYDGLGDKLGVAMALNRLANVALMQHDYDTARPLLEQCLALRRELDDRYGIVRALDALGAVAHNQGDYEDAHRLWGESLVLCRELGHARGVAAASHNLGQVNRRLGDLPAAQALFQESLTLHRQLGDKPGIATSLSSLSVVAWERGDYPAARTLFEASLLLHRELGYKLGTANLLHRMGLLALDQDDHATAGPLLLESLGLYQELGIKDMIVECIDDLAAIAGAMGPSPRAARLFGALVAIQDASGVVLSDEVAHRLELHQAKLRLHMGERAVAAAQAEEAWMSPVEVIRVVLAETTAVPQPA